MRILKLQYRLSRTYFTTSELCRSMMRLHVLRSLILIYTAHKNNKILVLSAKYGKIGVKIRVIVLTLPLRGELRSAFADSLDQDHTEQNMQSDLDPLCSMGRYFRHKSIRNDNFFLFYGPEKSFI